MKKIILNILLLIASAMTPQVSLAATGENLFASCSALSNESAYGEKYDDYKFLVPGTDGYIFRSEQDFYSDFSISDDNLDLFKRLTAALKKRNIDLVISLIPTRGMIEQKHLSASSPLAAGYNPETARQNYVSLIKKMNDAGIQVAGTAEIKDDLVYFNKADQHWTVAGAHQMAISVAEEVKSLPAYKKIKKAEFKTTPKGPVSFDGTFNRALGVLCGKKSPEETDVLTETVIADVKATDSALFGDTAVPEIVLLGTSNSKKKDNDMNFSGSLKEQLSADVYNAAVSGGGIDDSIMAYLGSDEFEKNPAKIIIWEFPSYYNLAGEDIAKTLRQAIPAIYGVCKNPENKPETIKISNIITPILDGKMATLRPDQSSLTLTFNEPVTKNFSGTIYYNDDKKESFSFKRRPEARGGKKFFYMPRALNKSGLKNIRLKTPAEMSGAELSVKICKIPKQ